jgi:hypothetical protein
MIATALLAAVIGGGAAAHELTSTGAQPHGHGQMRTHSHNAPVITQQVRIDCYRGPWNETIWDHPRAAFIDDLVMLGYEYGDASAVAYRVCRDVTAVGNSARLRSALLEAIAQTPPGHKPRYAH